METRFCPLRSALPIVGLPALNQIRAQRTRDRVEGKAAPELAHGIEGLTVGENPSRDGHDSDQAYRQQHVPADPYENSHHQPPLGQRLHEQPQR